MVLPGSPRNPHPLHMVPAMNVQPPGSTHGLTVNLDVLKGVNRHPGLTLILVGLKVKLAQTT